MHFGGSVSIATHMCLCNTTGLLAKFVTNIRNEMFLWTSCINNVGVPVVSACPPVSVQLG